MAEVITIKLEGEGGDGQPLDRAAPGDPQVKVNPVVLYQQLAREIERLEKAVLARAGGSMANAPGILQGELAAKAAGKAADMPLYDLILHLGDVADAFDQLDAAFGTIIMPLDEAKGALKLLEEQTAKNAAAAKEAAAQEKFLADARAELEKLAPTVREVPSVLPAPQTRYAQAAREQMEKEQGRMQDQAGIDRARRQIDPAYARRKDAEEDQAALAARRARAGDVAKGAFIAQQAGVPGAGAVAGVSGALAAAGPIGAIVAAADMAGKAVAGAVETVGKWAGAMAGLELKTQDVIRGFSDLASNVPIIGGILGAFGNTIAGLMDGLDKTTKRLAQYSPELATQQAQFEVASILRDIKRAQELGPQLLEFNQRKFEMDQRLQDIQQKLIEKLIPFLEDILPAVEDLLPQLAVAVEILAKILIAVAKTPSMLAELSGMGILMRATADSTAETAKNTRKAEAHVDFTADLEQLRRSLEKDADDYEAGWNLVRRLSGLPDPIRGQPVGGFGP